jgi:hypothetical protein
MDHLPVPYRLRQHARREAERQHQHRIFWFDLGDHVDFAFSRDFFGELVEPFEIVCL